MFVGVSMNLERILSEPDSGLTGRAAEALILLVAVLTASSLLLVPGQGRGLVGTEVLVVGIAAWAWVLAIQALRQSANDAISAAKANAAGLLLFLTVAPPSPPKGREYAAQPRSLNAKNISRKCGRCKGRGQILAGRTSRPRDAVARPTPVAD